MLSTKVENFITQEEVAIFNTYTWEKIRRSERHIVDYKGDLQAYIYEGDLGVCYDIALNDIVAGVYGATCKQKIEKLANKQVELVATFYRIYGPNSYLEKHVDRENYDYTATINISNNPIDCRWPIYTDDAEIFLNPGDAFVCQGNQVPHWREEFHGQWSTQLMLHYKAHE